MIIGILILTIQGIIINLTDFDVNPISYRGAVASKTSILVILDCTFTKYSLTGILGAVIVDITQGNKSSLLYKFVECKKLKQEK